MSEQLVDVSGKTQREIAAAEHVSEPNLTRIKQGEIIPTLDDALPALSVEEEHEQGQGRVRLILLGDVMLGRLVNQCLTAAPPEYPWGDTLAVLRSADAVVINLECVIADRGERWPGKTFTFRSDAKNVAVLKAAHVTAAALANNHAFDYGPEALQDCIAILRQHGICPVGAGSSIDAARAPAVFSVGTVRVAVVAFTDNEPGWGAGVNAPGLHYVPVRPGDPRFDRLLSVIARARRDPALVIVAVHWGPNWGYAPPPGHIEAAHLFVDAGADVVFGHSTHVVRGVELYRGKAIFYGCGDYVDDYAVDEVERNDESCVFCLDYEGRDLERILLAPTVIRNCQARWAAGLDRARILGRMQALCAELGTTAHEVPDGLEILPGSAASPVSRAPSTDGTSA